VAKGERRARRPTNGRQPLPPPLPPGERTVGQLVAEALRLYGRRFWPSLALGVGPAAAGVGLAFIPGLAQLAFALTAGALLVTASYVGACLLAAEAPLSTGRIPAVAAAGVLMLLPVPFLASLFIFPAVAWLALLGFAVPAIVLEGRGFRAAFRRSLELARADYVHALGGLATLVLTGLLTATVLFFLLRGQGEATLNGAAFLSVLVISPLLFLGAALLYFDQVARVERPRTRVSRRWRS